MSADIDTEDREARKRKLSFRAWRRGFKEADIILGNYADERLPGMTDAELDIFEVLLEIPDQDLYGWIIGREETPEASKSTIMSELNIFYKSAYKYV
jgi:antitoxin CptB